MPRFAPPPGEPRLVGQPRIRRAKRIEGDAHVPPGKVAFTRGPGTFHARQTLRELGGRWEPDLLGGVWLVPFDNADDAEAAIREAERHNPDHPAPGTPVESIRCYACGKKYTAAEMGRQRHAVVADWYCGCADREKGPPPRIAQVRR